MVGSIINFDINLQLRSMRKKLIRPVRMVQHILDVKRSDEVRACAVKDHKADPHQHFDPFDMEV